MAQILYEQQSPRGDHGVLTWNQGETFSIPIRINLLLQDGQIYQIQEDDFIELCIKQDYRNIENLYKMIYTNIKRNIIFLTVDEQLTKILRRGNYVLMAKIISNNDIIDIIHKLPINVVG